MTKCGICKRKREPGSGTFFNIPKDEQRRIVWSTACRQEFSPSSRICYKHFQPSDIITAGRNCMLMPNAVPIVQSLHKDTSQKTSYGYVYNLISK